MTALTALTVYEIGAAWESAIAEPQRRNYGSHYTPSWLAQRIVEITLQAVVYHGVADGCPMGSATLKSAAEIQALRVVDLCCGAGVFLFTATHYLALKLCEAWALEQGVDAAGWRLLPLVPNVVTPIEVTAPESQAWLDQNLPVAILAVLKHCVRGVDLDNNVVTLTQILFWLQSHCDKEMLTLAREHIISEDALQDEWTADMLDVFDAGGFDAVIGNPPYLGGHKITGVWGRDYREELVSRLAKGKRGSADICAYFLLQSHRVLKEGGVLGIVATNTICQGDTREVGLDQLLADGSSLYHWNPSMPWPGKAAVHVALLHLYKGEWNGPKWQER